MRLLEFNGRTYAVGLWWQVTDPGAKKVLAKARSTAAIADDGYDSVVLMPRQFGLGRFPGGSRRKAYSLAASLRVSVASYLGLFRLEEGVGDDGLWWVFAVRNGLISAEGDRLFPTREEAGDHARSLKDLGGDFELEEVFSEQAQSRIALQDRLASPRGLFDRGHAVLPLHEDRQGQKRRAVIAASIAGFALVSFGANYWLDAREVEKQRDAMREVVRARESARQHALANAASYFIHLWETEPNPAQRAEQCMDRMRSVPLVASGWLLDAVTCSNDSLVISWAHQPGASFLTPPLGAHVEARTATSRDSLSRITPSPSLEPLRSVSEITAHLYQVTQDASAKLRLSWSAPDKKKIDGVEVVAPWVRGTWELASVPAASLADGSLPHALSTLPGLVLSSIEYRGGVWTIKGVTHANQ
jgi:hypothetical protein